MLVVVVALEVIVEVECRKINFKKLKSKHFYQNRFSPRTSSMDFEYYVKKLKYII